MTSTPSVTRITGSIRPTAVASARRSWISLVAHSARAQCVLQPAVRRFDRRLAEAERRLGYGDGALPRREGGHLSSLVAEFRGEVRAERRRLRRASAWHSALGGAHARPDREMVRQQVKLLLIEPYFDLRTPDAIARAAGARVVQLSPSVGGARADYRLLRPLRP